MSNNKLIRNTLLLTIGTLVNKGLLFIMIPFFSRWISTSDYGTFDLICTYVTLFIPIIDLATGEAMFRFSVEDQSKDNLSKQFTNGIAIVIINLFLYSIIIIILQNIFKFSNLIPFMLLLIGELLNNYLRAVLRAVKRLDIYSLSSAISVIIIVIFTIVFIKIFNLGLTGIILGYGIGYILGNLIIIIWIKLWKYINIKQISLSNCKQMIAYSLPLIPNNVSWWIMNVSDRLIINIFLGPIANGIYAIANKVPALCTSIFGMFSISWQQSAIENVDNGKEERDNYFNSIYNNTILIMISLCIGLLSINFILFDYIFDSKYNNARMYVPILITAIIFSTLCQFFGGIQISFKETKENGISTIWGAVINIITNLIFIKSIGIYAAAISTFISYFCVAIIRYMRIREKIKFKIKNETKFFILVYVYFVFIVYINTSIISKILNIILAILIFLLINSKFIFSIIKKY